MNVTQWIYVLPLALLVSACSGSKEMSELTSNSGGEGDGTVLVQSIPERDVPLSEFQNPNEGIGTQTVYSGRIRGVSPRYKAVVTPFTPITAYFSKSKVSRDTTTYFFVELPGKGQYLYHKHVPSSVEEQTKITFDLSMWDRYQSHLDGESEIKIHIYRKDTVYRRYFYEGTRTLVLGYEPDDTMQFARAGRLNINAGDAAQQASGTIVKTTLRRALFSAEWGLRTVLNWSDIEADDAIKEVARVIKKKLTETDEGLAGYNNMIANTQSLIPNTDLALKSYNYEELSMALKYLADTKYNTDTGRYELNEMYAYFELVKTHFKGFYKEKGYTPDDVDHLATLRTLDALQVVYYSEKLGYDTFDTLSIVVEGLANTVTIKPTVSGVVWALWETLDFETMLKWADEASSAVTRGINELKTYIEEIL